MILENSYTKIQLYINSGKFTIDSSEWFNIHNDKINYLLTGRKYSRR